MINNVPPAMWSLWRRLGRVADEIGIRAYVVGGAVRDTALGLSVRDVDVVVEGAPARFAERVARRGGFRITRFPQFGTFRLEKGDGLWRVDIAMSRAEEYPAPGKLPVVRPAPLAEDQARRDISINALAVSLNGRTFGKLWDACGGWNDLEKGCVRALHDRSFVDDPTRLFRIVRYEQRYGFQITPATRAWMKGVMRAGAVETVSDDRWDQEWRNLFEESSPYNAVYRLSRLGVLEAFGLSSSLVKRARPVFQKLSCVTGRGLEQEVPPTAWWLTALVEVGGALDRFRISRRTKGEVSRLVGEVSDLRRRCGKLGRLSGLMAAVEAVGGVSSEAVRYFEIMERETSMGKRLRRVMSEWWPVKVLVTGHDLKQWKIPPGPAYRRMLEAVRVAVAEGVIPAGRKYELRYLRELCYPNGL